jgi:hypothetical protein
MEWKKTKIELGRIMQGKLKTIIFIPVGIIPLIKKITSSCGCSTPSLKNNMIIVNYVPEYVPSHLLHIGFYTTRKTITIIYQDDSIDTLSFIATVIK